MTLTMMLVVMMLLIEVIMIVSGEGMGQGQGLTVALVCKEAVVLSASTFLSLAGIPLEDYTSIIIIITILLL